MPINWTDEKQIERFKSDATGAGFSTSDIDSYIQNNKPAIPPISLDSSGFVNITKKDTIPSPTLSQQPSDISQQPMPVEEAVPVQSSSKILTQPFGNRSSIEKYSGGVNLGADFRGETGTQLRSPDGNWVVSQASAGFNKGSGNYVQIQNTDTGEKMGFEHLSKIGVRPGQKLGKGILIGLSGNSGNSTGPHISIPIQDRNGKYFDISKTPYINQIF